MSESIFQGLFDGGTVATVSVQTFLLCIGNHVFAYAVLYAACRVVQFQLGKQLYSIRRSHMIQFYQRRFAYQLLHGFVIAHLYHSLSAIA